MSTLVDEQVYKVSTDMLGIREADLPTRVTVTHVTSSGERVVLADRLVLLPHVLTFLGEPDIARGTLDIHCVADHGEEWDVH